MATALLVESIWQSTTSYYNMQHSVAACNSLSSLITWKLQVKSMSAYRHCQSNYELIGNLKILKLSDAQSKEWVDVNPLLRIDLVVKMIDWNWGHNRPWFNWMRSEIVSLVELHQSVIFKGPLSDWCQIAINLLFEVWMKRFRLNNRNHVGA